MLRRPKFRKRGATHGERHRLARLEVLEPRCVLSAPTLAPIPNVTLYAGAPLHIALDGFDADGDALTYSASSTGAALTTTIPQGNRSMKISVENYGDMVFELFEDLAPRTTQQVVELADSKFYDRLTFHRVIDGVMIVGGDPQGTGLGGSGVLFDDEFHPDLQHTGSGVLSMAKGSDDTNDSQFLITDAAARQLDFNHTVFGFLTAGEDVRDRINSTPADEWNRPLTPIVMDSVSVFHDEENGVLRLAAPHGASGQADVTVTVSDGQGGDAQQTFRVSILPDPSNSPPFLLPIQAIRTSIDTAFQVSIPAQDIENDSIYYAGAGSPANPNLQVDVNASTGNVVVTPKNGLMGVHGMVAMVRAVNGNTWDSQAVPIYVAPNAPTQLQLLSSADTGRSTSDRITNLDNGDGRTLRFVVSGLVPGAEVSLYAGDQRIGQAVAAATSATLETNGNVDLLDGVYSITASQTLANQAVNVGNLHTHVNLLSRPSLPVSITVDTLAPQFLSTPVAEAGEEVEYVYEPQTDDDANGQPAYALLEAPDGMAVDPTSGRLTWTPTTAQRGNHAVTLEVADLAGNATQQQFELAVMPVNRPPELDLPAERTVPQNIDVAIAGIRVFDPDAGAADIEVSCRVDHGTLALKTDVVGGLTAADIAGNGTADVVLTGSPVRINATLAASGGLSYRSTTGYVGRDTLTITADDKGNVGAGGAKTAAGEVVITVGSAASNQLLPGTPQDDLVTITPGEIPGQWIADVNGTLYWLVGNNVSATFDGIDGYDTVNFVGGGGPDMAVLRPTTAELSGPGYSISIANVDAIDYQGGDGEDTVTIWGSKGTNRYYANPGTGEMTGDGVSIFARAENIYARGNGGGDTVLFGDSPGDDVLEYFPIWARMRGEGYFHHVRGFRTMEADAERGINGTDRVVFRGSGLNDFLLVMPASARFLSGTGSVWHIARGFDTIVGYGRGGKQIDELILRDTPGDDAFKLEPLLATLTTPDYTVTAHGFGTVRAVRQNLNAADDQMALSGSKSDDTLIGNPEEVTLGSDQLGYSNTAVGFPAVRAYSSGEGHDVARFSDVTGPTDSRTESDTFTANPMVAQLAGPGYHLWARLFDEVYAEAKSGRDVANLTGNSNPDQVLATAEEVSLSGTNSVSAFIHRVRFFDEVNAFSGTGQDKATLTGAAVESTYGPPDGVALENLPQVLWLNQFPVIELQSGEITDVGRVFAYWGGPAIGGLNISRIR